MLTFSIEYQIFCLTCLVSCTVHSHVKSGQLSNESSLLDSRVASLAVNPQQDPKCFSVNVHGETLRSLLNKQVEYDSIRSKVSDALQSVLDPDKLVLDAIMGIYPSNLKGDEGFKLCVSRNFILLLKQLIGVSPQIKPLVKVEATKFANDWKSRLKKKRDDPLEVLAFLQFLVAYGLASSFYANEVLRLLDTDVWRKKIPDLCRVLGLTDIMPSKFPLSLSLCTHKSSVLNSVHIFLKLSHLNGCHSSFMQYSNALASLPSQKELSMGLVHN